MQVKLMPMTPLLAGSGACPDIRRFNRPCATRISTASVFPASICLLKLNPITPIIGATPSSERIQAKAANPPN